MTARIVVLPGDGIGPEVIAAALEVLGAVAKRGGRALEVRTELLGGAAIDATGEAMPERTRAACLDADAVLLGAVGGPRWDDPRALVRPEQGLLALRRAMGVFANLRPVRLHAALADASPLRPERIEGADLLFVRELTGGLYFGTPKGRTTDEHGVERAVDTLIYDAHEIERVIALAFRLAAERRREVTSVDKANVLESSRLWREIADRIAGSHRAITLEHQLVDSCAMRLLTHAQSFDVIVTENMFGDILTDEAAALAGSLGLLPSASLGEGTRGLYEPIHGSAPAIAGLGVANPVGAVLSAAMMARHSLGWSEEAASIDRAVDRAIASGARTRDLGGALGTREMTAAVLAELA